MVFPSCTSWFALYGIYCTFRLILKVVGYFVVLTDRIQLIDRYSAANLHEVVSLHYDLDLFIDLHNHILNGTVVHRFRFISSDVTRIVLDTRDIKVHKVYGKDNKKTYDYTIAPFNYITNMKNQQLVIYLDTKYGYGKELNISIVYSAAKTATAVNWVSPSQTFGKEHPFMYTQCEAIECRSIIPIQDSPSVKSTFDVRLSINKTYKAIASAVFVGEEKKENITIYNYSQKIPVPSYLFALVAGEIEYKDMGRRCRVYAEPSKLNESVTELSQMEDFLDTIETVLTPYIWGTYSVVVMPFSFPYGGMENPYLTFVSPSIIVGDKSSANVVAHEICHSWFGNQVTGKNWSHFWLNEGFTVYAERLIGLKLNGTRYYESQSRIGGDNVRTLAKELKDGELTKLFPNVYRDGPDGIMSNIAYEKGYLFLKYLEDKIGIENFYGFLRAYLTSYSYKSIEVSDMRRAFEAYTSKLTKESLNADPKDLLADIEWSTWLYKGGIPSIAKNYTNEFIEKAIKLADCYLTDGECKDVYGKFGLDLRIIFMRQLLLHNNNLTEAKIKIIDNDNKVTVTEKNPEVLTLWYRMAISKKYTDVDEKVKEFLKSIGRQKYIVRLYEAYVHSGKKEYIQNIYKELKDTYHPIAQRAIDKILA